jgi:hypothetical protein
MHTRHACAVVPQTSPLEQPAFVAVLCPFGVLIDVVKDVRLVPLLRAAPPKLPVLLLKMAAAEVPVVVKFAVAVGEGEYRNCHGFSFSLLLLANVLNRDS